MSMEININKPLITAEPADRSVSAPVEGMLEQFSLILDEAVSKTREKTSAADNPPEKLMQPNTKKNLPPETAANFAALFGLNKTAGNSSVKEIRMSEPSVSSADEEINTPEEKTEIKSVPGGMIQTEMQQVIEKVNRSVTIERLDQLEAKPQTKMQVPSALNFEEIYAQVKQALQMRQDGQILKLKFELEPENLGRLDIYIFAEKKHLHISFVSGVEARKILELAGPELQEILAQYGYSLADLDFSGYSGGRQQELENRFLAQNEQKNDFGVLKIVNKKDIIREIAGLVRDMLVNYLA